jgi:CheY-like chemotaxis protein
MSSSSPPTLLLVDDDFPSLEVLGLLFEGEGFRVLSAGNGAEALALLEAQTVDLVVTDFMMPLMDGVELAQRLRADARFAKLPVVLTSASFQLTPEAQGLFAAIFRKPFLFDEVLAAVRRSLGGLEPG